jgi:uncharacterized surface anchored protein
MILDEKDIFKKKEKAEAIRKRYGKEVTINIYYETNNGEMKTMDDLKFQVLDIFSFKNKRYKITEYFKSGLTDYVTLEYNINGRIIKNKFDRFLDAEVSMVDKIAEE